MKTCPFHTTKMVNDAVCESCILKHISICNILKKQDVELIKYYGNIVHFKKGEIIYKQGTVANGLICLLESTVKIVKTAIDGSDEVLSIHTPIDLLGIPELMAECYHPSSAIALDNIVVNIIPKEQVKLLFHNNPDFLYKISQYLSHQLFSSQRRTEKLTKKHVRGRLADSLLELHSKYECIHNKDEIRVNLRRADLASYSNMTTANAIRTLSDFSKSGLIEIKGRKIVIKDILELKKISQFG